MDQGIDLDYLLGVLKRRWPLVAVPAAFGIILSAFIAYVLPPVYESRGLILVESQQIPSELAQSTVAADASERVQVIRQRLVARENLLDAAARYNVFGDLELSPTEVVERMRDALSIDAEANGRRAGNSRGPVLLTTISIGFEANRPDIAIRVANEFLTQLLEENAQQRSTRANETLAFFNQDVDRLGSEMSALESRVAEFKRENESALPESLAFRRTELSALQNAAFDRRGRRLALDEQKRLIEDAIAVGRAAPGALASPEQQELARLRSTLTQQRAVLSETHPSIRALTARIAALESVAPEEEVDQSAGVSGESSGGGIATEAMRQVERIEAELDLLDEQQERDEARMRELEESIARTPQVEIQLDALERDKAALKEQYARAVLKRAEAQTGERLEANRQAERFEVLEPPQLPEAPIAPNRILIAGAGSFVGVALGFALMVLVELLNRSIHSARDLERALQIRPIVAIPYIETQAERAWRRWRLRSMLLFFVLAVPLAILVIDIYYLPIQVLIERLLERAGIDTMLNTIRMRFGG